MSQDKFDSSDLIKRKKQQKMKMKMFSMCGNGCIKLWRT